MRIGQLRHRIELLREQATPDGMGGTQRTWVPYAEVWASVEPLRGREFFQAQQTQAAVTHKVTIRYAAVTTADRIKFGDRVLNIIAVLDAAERHQWLTLLCEERTPNA